MVQGKSWFSLFFHIDIYIYSQVILVEKHLFLYKCPKNFIKNQFSINLLFYFWTFFSVPLVCLPIVFANSLSWLCNLIVSLVSGRQHTNLSHTLEKERKGKMTNTPYKHRYKNNKILTNQFKQYVKKNHIVFLPGNQFIIWKSINIIYHIKFKNEKPCDHFKLCIRCIWQNPTFIWSKNSYHITNRREYSQVEYYIQQLQNKNTFQVIIVCSWKRNIFWTIQ